MDSLSLNIFYWQRKIPINGLLPTHLSSTTMRWDYRLVNVYLAVYISREKKFNSDDLNPLYSFSLNIFYWQWKIPIYRLLPTHLSSTTMWWDYQLVNVYFDCVYQLRKVKFLVVWWPLSWKILGCLEILISLHSHEASCTLLSLLVLDIGLDVVTRDWTLDLKFERKQLCHQVNFVMCNIKNVYKIHKWKYYILKQLYNKYYLYINTYYI